MTPRAAGNIRAPSFAWTALAPYTKRGMADSMDDQLAVLHLVCGRLEAAGIAYPVTGSLAAAFYAQPRMT